MSSNNHSLQYRGITIQFEQGDLSRRTDDALAISCDIGFHLNSPLCGTFLRLAGSQLKTSALQQLQNYPQLYSNNQPIAICVPASGRIRSRSIILLPIHLGFSSVMTTVFREMFQSAIQANSQSLAFPPIGTGGYRLLSHYDCAQAIYDALKSIPNHGNLTTITIVNTSHYWIQEYYDNLSSIIESDQTQQQPISNGNLIPSTSIQQSTSVPQSTSFDSSFRLLQIDEVRALHSDLMKEKQKEIDAPGSSSDNPKEDRLELCPICLCDMFDEIDNYDPNSETTLVEINRCTHRFHKSCLIQWLSKKGVCPICTLPCITDIRGNQPDGTMRCHIGSRDLAGYPGDGHIRIDYMFPSGIQTAEHPSPGKHYSGTSRSCYLPNNSEGKLVKDLLCLAFKRRLIFSVGDSLTSNRNNTVVWNIHHKTSMSGGPTRYGYPDPTYLQRVKEELAALGITESLLNQTALNDPDLD